MQVDEAGQSLAPRMHADRGGGEATARGTRARRGKKEMDIMSAEGYAVILGGWKMTCQFARGLVTLNDRREEEDRIATRRHEHTYV